jgi:hypothetical protein
MRRGLTIPLIFGLTLFCLNQTADAFQNNQSPDRIWQILDKDAITITASQLATLQQVIPRRFEMVRLDQRRLTRALSAATPHTSATVASPNTTPQSRVGIRITLPMPDRTYARFLVQETSMMEPELERQFPNFKSYRGQGIDDPTMSVRFDQTPNGFHAIVLSPDRMFYIDPFPLRRDDRETHITFFKDDYPTDEKHLRCLVGEDEEGRALLNRRGNRAVPQSNGEMLRTYRLAVAATGEYTKFHGGTVQGAFNAIYTTVNRVNAIYENELAVSLKLIRDQTKIIYTDADKDPYTNSSVIRLLSENQKNLDEVIGSDKYDIGHVFCVGGGGVATLRSVGRNGAKARGVTGSDKPVGDAFDVDFVAHEMGHQFGANHTFNATTGSCGSGNRNPATAYEPGSGSTIMAYAGICGESDLQPNSHSYFHAASLEEIISYVTSDDMKLVAAVTPTHNHPPSIIAGQNFTIPQNTPFALRATGTDLDGDAVTYSWEQFDLGEPSPPEGDLLALRPLFRSFTPARNAVRFFPRMENLFTGQQAIGESLPVHPRVMSFRVTARDNRAGGGGVSYTTASVSVVTNSGPFVVSQPDPATVWTVGTSQTVTWNVAGTSAVPVSCGNVRISLSTDGGKTFTVLLPSTPNTGTATVKVPNKPAAQARIMVEAVDNAFFNISRGDFKIVSR